MFDALLPLLLFAGFPERTFRIISRRSYAQDAPSSSDGLPRFFFVSSAKKWMETSTVSRAVEIGLRACGVWPYLPLTVPSRLFWIVMLSTAQIFQYRYVVVHYHDDNFSDFMDGMSCALTYSLLFIKLAILWANQR